MKAEIKLINDHDISNLSGVKPIMIISKTELIKLYEQDKNLLFDEFNLAIEMFCTPHCFKYDIDLGCFNKIINTVKLSKYKALVFSIFEDPEQNYHSNLNIKFQCK